MGGTGDLLIGQGSVRSGQGRVRPSQRFILCGLKMLWMTFAQVMLQGDQEAEPARARQFGTGSKLHLRQTAACSAKIKEERSDRFEYTATHQRLIQIARAWCRAGVCRYVWTSVVEFI